MSKIDLTKSKTAQMLFEEYLKIAQEQRNGVVDPLIDNNAFNIAIANLGECDSVMNEYYLDEGALRSFLARYLYIIAPSTPDPLLVTVREALILLNGFAQHDDDCKINRLPVFTILECTCGYRDASNQKDDAIKLIDARLGGE